MCIYACMYVFMCGRRFALRHRRWLSHVSFSGEGIAWATGGRDESAIGERGVDSTATDAQCGQLTAELAQTYLDMAKEEVDAVVEAAALGMSEWRASALCIFRGCILSASCVCLGNDDAAQLTTIGTVRQTVGRRKDHCGAGDGGGNGDEKP